MGTSVTDICQIMEKLAPCHLAEEWDNVGLMLGDRNWQVKKIMLALDLTQEVANQAYLQKADMIITHHPFFFAPMKKLVCNDGKNTLVYELIKRQIAVYSAHTNLDITEGGVNDVLADILGVTQTIVLKPIACDSHYKLVVFVPETHCEEVLAALRTVDAGHIGNYADCAYVMEGMGQFRPLEGSSPFIGQESVLTKTREKRIEVLVRQMDLQKTISAVMKAHPYEEPAYDVFAMENQAAALGLGRVGVLENAVSLAAFADNLKNVLSIDHVTVVDAGKQVYKVAICGGSGADLIGEAVKAGADTLVTGDVKYHIAQEAFEAGLNLVDAGHQATEMPVLLKLRTNLQECINSFKHDVEVCVANESKLLRHL